MKPSQLLKKAKKHLAKSEADYFNKGKFYYICHAVSAATESTTEPLKSAIIVRDHIHKLLNGWSALEVWLQRCHNIFPYSDRDKLQQTRHAWIDDMIQYFKAQGK